MTRLERAVRAFYAAMCVLVLAAVIYGVLVAYADAAQPSTSINEQKVSLL